MNKYQEIFERIPSVEELTDIKDTIKEDNFDTWEDLYWCIKSICVYDSDSCDDDLLVKEINKTIKLGLNLHTDNRKYIDIIKVLVTLYSQVEQYEKVIEILNPIIEENSSVPDWVYHDYISAEIHTDNIISIIQNPQNFISKLEKNQRNSKAIQKKQRAIFIDLITTASTFIGKYDVKVDIEVLTKEANKFGLNETEGWTYFVEKCNQVVDKPIEISELKLDTHRNNKNNIFKNYVSLMPDTKGAIDRKYEEALKQLEIKEKEIEDKRLELEQQTLKLEKLAEENEVLQENAKASEKEKKDMQEMIDYAERANEKLREEIKASSIKQETDFSLAVSDPIENLIGHMHSFQYIIQIALAKWLNDKLPDCATDWWNYCVLKTLSYEQRQRAFDNRYSSIDEFDLPALLRITSRNWYKLKQYIYLSDSDYKCLDNMFEVRNRWAHSNVRIPNIDVIKDDLTTMQEFMVFIGCSREKILSVKKYQSSIEKIIGEV